MYFLNYKAHGPSVLEDRDGFNTYTNEFKEKHPEVEWKVIIGMRHVLVHDYYQISDEMVWATIQTELLPLKEKVELYKRKLE